MKYKALIIGISGPSSSGKTTLARLLQSVFQNQDLGQRQDYDQSHGADALQEGTFIIHEDDFYLPDDQIPYTTLPCNKTLQDWDTIHAVDIPRLAKTLSHVREHGALPRNLRSIQDLNEAGESGVSGEVLEALRWFVRGRLGRLERDGDEGEGKGRTLAFIEGILLFSPPSDAGHVLSDVHSNIDVHLFLPAAYEDVKARRESRSGYVTAGPSQQQQQPPLPQRTSSATSADLSSELGESAMGSGQEAQPSFWEDPPGYVDDIVWPHYVQDHAWLLLPEGERWSEMDAQEIVKKVGRGVDARTDVGVAVAPGQGSKPMVEVLKWAVDEVLKGLEAVQ